MKIEHYHPTKYWHPLDNGKIQCDVCPRACQLAEGQRGLCFVRMRDADAIVLTTYGRSSGFCIDPVEKKPLNHFLPGTPVLSFGTAGCNLHCKFCQNWDISKARDMDKLTNQASPKALADMAKKLQCSSVAFTYNDPVIFMEYAIDVAKACHEQGIKAIAVSAGYMCPEPRQEFYQYMDAANIDLKAFTESFYHKVTGSHLHEVLDTLVYLKRHTQVWFEITNLVIPGANDDPKEIEQMCQWIASHLGVEVPLHFSAFHPDYKMMDTPPTPPGTLLRCREIALKQGLHYVYVGNMHNKKADSTYCTGCKKILIGRDWYELSEWNLTEEGACKFCGTQCAGVFDGKPGDWGRKRVPVMLG